MSNQPNDPTLPVPLSTYLEHLKTAPAAELSDEHLTWRHVMRLLRATGLALAVKTRWNDDGSKAEEYVLLDIDGDTPQVMHRCTTVEALADELLYR